MDGKDVNLTALLISVQDMTEPIIFLGGGGTSRSS